MTTLKIRIPGTTTSNHPDDDTDELTIEKTIVITPATRSDLSTHTEAELDETKIVEFTYDDGTVWIGNYQTIDEIFPGTSEKLRSLENDESGVLDIPAELVGSEQTRGLGTIVLKVVKLFTKKKVLSPLVKDLAAKLEQKHLTHGTGLFRLSPTFEFTKPTFGPEGEYLLFLHGTATSTEGSFGDLKGTTAWNFIHQTYENQVLAFEHESLTASPLQNVLDLVKELPSKANLTLVSQSRGGLVGDILNRYFGNEAATPGFSASDKNYLRKQDRQKDLDLIEKIENVVASKNIIISKYIRVACPSSGSTLASRRLNIYLNVIFNIVGLATGGAANPVYTAFKDLLAGLVDSKDDPSVLPGLEVQNPRSPFNQMLNNVQPETLISTPLIILAGDAKASLRWQGLKVILSNLFFWSDNDFVVDTQSMYNGARRAQDRAQYFFDTSTDVSHFNYFKNERTRNALLLALKNTDNTLIPGFTRLQARNFTEAEIRNIESIIPGGSIFQDTVSGKKPIVVLLPGIMGSTLTVREKLVWINFLGFTTGQLTHLRNSEDNNPNVKATGLVGSSYRKLVDYFKQDYDVITFPFDWRSSLVAGAATFNRRIEQLLEWGQPIKIIAHSMGGVLVRDFMVYHEGTWNKLKASKDFRLVFLGAPLGGAFRIPYVLFGLDSLIRKLDFLDFTHTQKELLEVFSRFPGILNLLPLTTDADNDFAQSSTWDKMRKAFNDDQWPVPDQKVLDEFGAYRDKILAKAATLDYGPAAYIAGQTGRRDQTISGYRIVKKGKDNGEVLEFLATKEGDGSVTWASGIPRALLAQNSVYYSRTTHGELANEPELFGAMTDLLESGSTAKLSRVRPAIRGLDTEFKAKDTFDFDFSPEGVERTLLGLEADSSFTVGDIPISVSVSNGDLKYAQYPVMVGHFENDGIQSAEKAIDWHLNGELSRRERLGLYSGAIGASEMVDAGKNKIFKGAIIVGLGQHGQLTEYRLTITIERGISKYLANLNSQAPQDSDLNQKSKPNGISSLFISSGFGGLKIESSIRAIIQGVQNANAKIRQVYSSPKTIETIEFVELYKDRALAGMKSLCSIESAKDRSLNIFKNTNKIKKLSGWRERLPVDDTAEWWTRITVVRAQDESPHHRIKFTISTDAARSEEREISTIDATLSVMLDGLSTQDQWSPELAKTIFELMIPNDFKDQVKRQNNINWILDPYTAGFPWELLQDSVANARPLSVNAGMIRQLSTPNFRINPNPVTEETAIVIGDPNLNNPNKQLKAALLEGEKVTEMLQIQGFTVSSLLSKKATEILMGLFSKNYKIVHLAGHGIFNSDPNQPTGMLIGENAYLTPAHIDQMSGVPELVFVNCCFLGDMDAATEELTSHRTRLAANLGTQLIINGVKAVVVAGWAVNDTAALDFAERFYQAMFEGNTFGEATKKARRAIYEAHGTRNNTWGAYQCYGDPYYQLAQSVSKPREVYSFIIPEEAEIELSNLLNKVESGGHDAEAILNTTDAIDKALVKASIQSTRIIELQALLYCALDKYELATVKFEQLWKAEKATFAFSTTEQYCNLQIKHFVKKMQKDREQGTLDPESEKSATDLIKDAIGKLESLRSFGETAERLNLIGSAYKRLAMVSTDQAKKNAYECSASFYRLAFRAGTDSSQYYSLTNRVFIENALVVAGTAKWGVSPLSKKETLAELDGELKEVQKNSDQEKDYGDWIAEGTLLLCQLMLKSKSVAYITLLEKYKEGWQTGSPGQNQSQMEQLDFLKDVLEMGGDKAKDLLEIVIRLRLDLQALM
ncbi:CHAT domain-containing protein [Salmonirosea aquatica]|uniref:CHAT domain-containing protein n=1 Tax=Salmonirosea aquatica TaxID=2654236 RepID=A0A7C9FC73_9BACT|nr:CHAT domain-containing protein [Cytophagaceae bacterium SJW1-29]